MLVGLCSGVKLGPNPTVALLAGQNRGMPRPICNLMASPFENACWWACLQMHGWGPRRHCGAEIQATYRHAEGDPTRPRPSSPVHLVEGVPVLRRMLGTTKPLWLCLQAPYSHAEGDPTKPRPSSPVHFVKGVPVLRRMLGTTKPLWREREREEREERRGRSSEGFMDILK